MANFGPPVGPKWKVMCDAYLVSIWLLFLTLINQISHYPVSSMVPYLLPVIAVSMKYGLMWGFICAALATLAAIPAGYLETNSDHLYWAGLTTYLKLSVAAVGVWYGMRIVERAHDSDSQ